MIGHRFGHQSGQDESSGQNSTNLQKFLRSASIWLFCRCTRTTHKRTKIKGMKKIPTKQTPTAKTNKCKTPYIDKFGFRIMHAQSKLCCESKYALIITQRSMYVRKHTEATINDPGPYIGLVREREVYMCMMPFLFLQITLGCSGACNEKGN